MPIAADVMLAGKPVPRLFYGTAWKEDRTEALTALAMQQGFRAIDSANQRRHYFEAGVGAAIQAALANGTLARDNLFLQTKFTYPRSQDHRLPYDPNAPTRIQVEQSFASSLQHFRTTRLDSYLLHGPSTAHGLEPVDFEAWHAMEALARSGAVRFLGISNVTLRQLQQLWGESDIHPSFVQNRCYASTGWDRNVRHFCNEHGILYQGFSLLTANRAELGSPAFQRIVKRSGTTPAEVAFRFALAIGMIALTGTSRAEHMRKDLACVDFDLSDAEVAAIESISG
jgi:diketogulonate reductase-like aldo/keto reductase